MKQIIIAIVGIFALTTTAFADYSRRGYQGPSYAQRQYYQPKQHYHKPRGNNWIGPAIGGLALGGLAYGAYDYYNRRPRHCWDEPIIDRWNRIVGYERFCR